MNYRIALVAALSIYITAAASPSSADTAMIGAGGASCSLINTQHLSSLQFFPWIQGYLSGLNAGFRLAGKAIFDLGSVKEVQIWAYVVSYCRGHPSEFVVTAVNDFAAAKLPSLTR